jgi:hypothetical protein
MIVWRGIGPGLRNMQSEPTPLREDCEMCDPVYTERFIHQNFISQAFIISSQTNPFPKDDFTTIRFQPSTTIPLLL